MRCGNGCQRILRVVHTRGRHLRKRPLHNRAQPHHAIVVHAPAGIRVELFNTAPAAHRKYTIKRFAFGVDNHETVASNGTHQMMELLFNGGQVFKNVCVIELKIVENRR